MLFQVVKSKKQSNYPTMGNYDVTMAYSFHEMLYSC